MRVEDIFEFLNELAPVELAEPWDNVGVLVNCNNTVENVLVTLDITSKVVFDAKQNGCQLIVSHHPVIFKPLTRLESNQPTFKLVKDEISAICMHTNLDAADGGVNDLLAKALGLENIEKLPCGGRIGNLPSFMTVQKLAEKCGKTLKAHVRYTEGGKFIQTVAVVGGAGAFLDEAKAAGAQCLVTGDVKHHDGIDAIEMDLPLIGAGHFDTECLVVDYLVEQLTAKFPHLNVMKSEKTQDPFRYLEARS